MTPLLAIPADGSAGAWRLSVWPVDGGTLPIQVATIIDTSPAVPGQPALQSALLQGARTNVAMRLPLPAGMEPLNPNLATAPANAAPSAAPTLAPDYAAYDDDQVLVVYQTLPQGTYTFRTRMRATVDGSFTQPPAQVETMYQRGVTGSSDGARVVVGR